MLSNPIWTLFFAKKSSKDWGFYDKETGEHIPWQEYTARNNNYILDMDGNPSTLLDE
jgi:SET domain-containing protein